MLSEDEIEDKLSKAIIIFQYIEDKDLFAKSYTKLLARRLLQKQTQSLEVEVAMITRLTVSFICISQDGERYLYLHPSPPPTQVQLNFGEGSWNEKKKLL